MLREASQGFFSRSSVTPPAIAAFDGFCEAEQHWLDDHALFMTASALHPGVDWPDWPGRLARRDPQALEGLARDHATMVTSASCSGSPIGSGPRCGPMRRPAAFGSWAMSRSSWHPAVPMSGAVRHLFDLDSSLRPRVIAGVPPDYFSATGQRWGNPLYRWERHHEEGYGWWIRRIAALLSAGRHRAHRSLPRFRRVLGRSPPMRRMRSGAAGLPGPGAVLFEALQQGLGRLPLIAEDLGIITEDVTALRERFGLPGHARSPVRLLGDASHAYLPHNHPRDTVVYTGTHASDTTPGLVRCRAPSMNAACARPTSRPMDGGGRMGIINAASQSVAAWAIYPMQDILGLGSDARMNCPGVAEGCWDWRFQWAQVQDWHSRRLREISAAHGRNDLPL
jgi:4-alpha-glucanotransferase